MPCKEIGHLPRHLEATLGFIALVSIPEYIIMKTVSVLLTMCSKQGFTLRYISVLLCGLLCGCASSVKTVPSPVNLPVEFSAAGELPLPDKWWEIFGDKTLNTYIERSLGKNFDLLIAWDRLAQAQAIAVKQGAALLPEVNANGQFSRTREETGSNANYYNRYGMGVSVGYEVDMWGRIQAVQQGALLDVQTSREDIDTTAIVLSARIAQRWYQLAESKAQVDIIKQQIETNNKVLSLITTRFQQGKAGAADVLRQRQLVESSRGQLILAQEQTELFLHELAVLLGTTPGSLTQPLENNLIDIYQF